MGKSRRRTRGDSEINEIQRLRYENDKLKKQISKLRKQLSRIDIDRYSNLKEMLEAHAAEDNTFDAKVHLEELKRKWICHKCKEDHLRVIVVPRADGVFYFRRCPSCSNKTKLQKYTDDINGIDTSGAALPT